MTRRTFVPFTITRDATVEAEYGARCVSGDEPECGSDSGACHDPAQVPEWRRKHTQQTRHFRYRRTFADYTVMVPPDGFVSGSSTTRAGRGKS
ncbi:hypothetical protein ADL27_27240 [Streptomyces sp. NRRL F-6602]|nr:hypothetical protein ADL27_27240 [Streptomyces sp. NRRL F-6602]